MTDILVYKVYRRRRFRWMVEGPMPFFELGLAEFGPYLTRRKAIRVAEAAMEVYREMEDWES